MSLYLRYLYNVFTVLTYLKKEKFFYKCFFTSTFLTTYDVFCSESRILTVIAINQARIKIPRFSAQKKHLCFMFCLISLINLEVSMKFRLERLPRDENFPAAAIAGTNLYYFFSSRGPHNKMILCHILRNILQELPLEHRLEQRNNKCYCLKS